MSDRKHQHQWRTARAEQRTSEAMVQIDPEARANAVALWQIAHSLAAIADALEEGDEDE